MNCSVETTKGFEVMSGCIFDSVIKKDIPQQSTDNEKEYELHIKNKKEVLSILYNTPAHMITPHENSKQTHGFSVRTNGEIIDAYIYTQQERKKALQDFLTEDIKSKIWWTSTDFLNQVMGENHHWGNKLKLFRETIWRDQIILRNMRSSEISGLEFYELIESTCGMEKFIEELEKVNQNPTIYARIFSSETTKEVSCMGFYIYD